MKFQKTLIFLVAIVSSILTFYAVPNSWNAPASYTAGIAVFMAFFWSFEILPLFVTSLLGVLALTLFVPPSETFNPYPTLIYEWGNPILLLFFGSFLIAGAMTHHKVDYFLAYKMLSQKGLSPLSLLFRIAAGTVVLSMWISNTASCAIVLGIVTGISKTLRHENKFSKGLILMVPLAANIGGIGTPIGTPPNAIALGLLRSQGYTFSFLDWMIMGVPLMVFFLIVAILGIYYTFPPLDNKSLVHFKSPPALSANGKVVLLLTGLTGLFLMASSFLGISESLVTLTTGTIFLAFGLIGKEDLKSIPWDVLLLLWGGLTLGVAIEKSGLGNHLVKLLASFVSTEGIVFLLTTITLVLSIFISNTAAISLTLPLSVTLNVVDVPSLAITLAITASIAMLLPVSTPPNMIACSRGNLSVKDMIQVTSWLVPVFFLWVLFGYFTVIPLFTRLFT